jgi:hypothetical protein
MTCLLALTAIAGWGQCVISRDAQGRVITTCQVRAAAHSGPLLNRPDYNTGISNQVIYLGSEYFGFPVWQDGTLRMPNATQEIRCKIAYNLVTRQVLCRLNGLPQEQIVRPETFTMNDVRFVLRDSQKANRPYLMVLYDGKTKFFKQLRCRFRPNRNEAYDEAYAFDGYYEQQSTYFLQRPNEKPRAVSLSRKAILDALGDPAGKLSTYLTRKEVTPDELVAALTLLDSVQ